MPTVTQPISSIVPLDTIHRVETPEGIEINIRTAGAVPRLYAFLLDLLVRIGIAIGCMLMFGWMGFAGLGLILIVMFVVEWLYPVFLEVLWDGKTIGKAAVGLRVVMDDGTPISWSASLIRNLLRMADFLPGFYLTGLIVSLFSDQSKRLGDIAAGTLVIYRDQKDSKPRLPPGVAKGPRVMLSVDERRTVTDFAERGALFSPARRAELANIVEPLTQARDVAGVARLVEMARWFTGHETKDASSPCYANPPGHANTTRQTAQPIPKAATTPAAPPQPNNPYLQPQPTLQAIPAGDPLSTTETTVTQPIKPAPLEPSATPAIPVAPNENSANPPATDHAAYDRYKPPASTIESISKPEVTSPTDANAENQTNRPT